jgi:two-component sensor histidine kinase
MATILSGRLRALAVAHSLVRRSFSSGIDQPLAGSLRDLIAAILKPYELPDCDRFTVEGTDIGIGETAATSLGLVLHEFATNAAKYGALTSDTGRVTITWEQQGERLILQWRESGGPVIAVSPQRQGFGGLLTRRTIEQQLGGTFSLNWHAEGLTGDFSLPLAMLNQ